MVKKRFWVFATVLTLSSVFTYLSAQPKLDPSEVKAAVERELLHDPALDVDTIFVEVEDDIVTLNGEIEHLMAGERASRLAGGVKGVASVVSRLQVKKMVNDGEALREAVELAFYRDPAVDSYEVTAYADDEGKVTLRGVVDSFAEKMLAEKVAGSVKGVRRVDNSIDINYKVLRADREIQKDIEQSLRWDRLVDNWAIDVRVEDGVVSLSGAVGSAAERSQAIVDAWVSGVRTVQAEELTVEKWARDEEFQGQKYLPKTDREIRAAVRNSLAKNPRVRTSAAKVEVNAGVVTLGGVVTSLSARRAAAAAARQTVGVEDVQNYIKVNPSETSDSQLSQALHQALRNNPYVDTYPIRASVVDGAVRLDGTVSSYFEKAQAEEVVAGVKGVGAIDNDLVVSNTSQPLVKGRSTDEELFDYGWYDYQPTQPNQTDQEIKANIETELKWSPYVDANDVTVEVDAGTATLQGVVESWPEFRAAAENAYQGGAIWVVNELAVKEK